jgi:hypothetical protein
MKLSKSAAYFPGIVGLSVVVALGCGGAMGFGGKSGKLKIESSGDGAEEDHTHTQDGKTIPAGQENSGDASAGTGPKVTVSQGPGTFKVQTPFPAKVGVAAADIISGTAQSTTLTAAQVEVGTAVMNLPQGLVKYAKISLTNPSAAAVNVTLAGATGLASGVSLKLVDKEAKDATQIVVPANSQEIAYIKVEAAPVVVMANGVPDVAKAPGQSDSPVVLSFSDGAMQKTVNLNVKISDLYVHRLVNAVQYSAKTIEAPAGTRVMVVNPKTVPLFGIMHVGGGNGFTHMAQNLALGGDSGYCPLTQNANMVYTLAAGVPANVAGCLPCPGTEITGNFYGHGQAQNLGGGPFNIRCLAAPAAP